MDAGILSADQQRQIIEFEEANSGRRSRVLTILAVLGATLVFLGIALVISQNWDEIGRLPKLVTGIVLMVACHAGGYWVRNGPLGLRRTGEALLLLATGLLFGNLALISQQYHIAFNPAPLLLPVFVSALAFAYLLVSRSHTFVATALFALWLATESQRDGSPIEAPPETVMFLLLGAGAWLAALGIVQRRSSLATLSPPAELVGGMLIAGIVYLLGFHRHYGIENAMPTLPAILLLIVPMALVAQALFVTGIRAEARLGWPSVDGGLRRPLLIAQLTLLLLLILTFVTAVTPGEHFVVTLGYWLGACLLTGSVVWLGLVLRREAWVNAALVFLGVFIVSRYFDFVGDYAQTGGVFLGAGILCLVVALALEVSRRQLARRMDSSAREAEESG